MPNKEDTYVGRYLREEGINLSGGERQKISIARGLYKEGKILVLDEPTSAMDAEAEAQMFGYFRSHTLNKMAILISHRFSTVRMADQIVYIDQGQIIEQGNHQELMELNQRYAHLFNLQASGYRWFDLEISADIPLKMRLYWD